MKRISISLPDPVVEALRAQDPLRRPRVAAYVKELVTGASVRGGPLLGPLVPPAAPPVRKGPPRPLGVRRRTRVITILKSSRGSGPPDVWFVSQSLKDAIERDAARYAVTLRMQLGTRVMYEVPYRPALLEPTRVNAIGGRPYWRVNCAGLKRCA